ncbi:hypothetical protein POV27_01950 [Aureisphaera galaxeae]|uniref:hypothetical protein n=1 Tax=Aureisphaera galaxeae TaxID=1538023 RepID=UPI00235007BB|nr:hypothetical protein [Aureisphaera galaxeae]MDC8002804.1 hypothetical protein [Aureisphaera galaxeae]
MKKLLTIIAFAFAIVAQAQTEGINYQAVIINPDDQQIPGPDANGNVLAEAEVSLRFTILNEDGSVVYQEVIETITDPYGMVNVFIGSGTSSSISNFNEINWDATPRNLGVELDIGRGFVFLSLERLTFVPQAYHRNIIADGDLTVQGTATFNSDFIIEGQTIINSGLDVNGDLNVGEDLNVAEDLNVGEDIVAGDDLTVNGRTDLNGNVYINNQSATFLSGRLEVERSVIVDQALSVGAGAIIGGDINGESGMRIAGDQTIGGRSNVVGSQGVAGNQSIGGRQTVVGDSRIEGDQLVLQDQRVNGEQLIIGSSVIEGDSSVLGAVDVGGSLDVSGPGNFSTSITVDQESNLLGTLTVEGATAINDDAAITGSLDVGNFLNVGDGGTYGGNLDVFGKATITQSFTVNGATSLEGTLKVNNGSPVFLSGALGVMGRSVFEDEINVINSAPVNLGGTLDVVKDAFFGDDVIIDGMLTVNNNLSLDGLTVSGNSGDHIAVFENTGNGGADGIAIQIDTPQLDSDNQFITFYGQNDYVAGRIESYDATGMSGQGGVVYGSTGADYAEWLEKETPSENFKIGEVVGVKGGKISRNTEGVDHVLTISMAPIVLGNMPNESKKEAYEKVGFMGQVPALVKGKVNKGDYIIASGNNDGYAIAVAPNAIGLEHLKRVIGKAWSSSQTEEASLINVSVGLKSGEWVRILELQEARIQQMEAKMKSLENLSERMKKLESKMDVLDMN